MGITIETVGKGLGWKLLERFGVYGIQFVLQIILARLLAPNYYGVLSLMIVFVNLATVFIQNGFNTALIQKKDIQEEDYSSVFWITLVIAFLIYCIFFACAPLVENFYNISGFTAPFRILTLVLFSGAYNSIQIAVVSRNLEFKKVFLSNVIGIFVSGIVGIAFAYLGLGLWALVAQYLLNSVISCFVMSFVAKLKIKFNFNFKRAQGLFKFGWKLLVSGLLDTLYTDLSSFIIGKKYNAERLAFYNRGQQFPSSLIGVINGSIQSVLLPALSQEQNDKVRMKAIMRRAVVTSSYVVIPMMMGLACIAKPLVQLLLTDKWLACVPYLQIFCFSFSFYPIHTSNLQALNAQGRSDVFLKLEIIKKAYGVSFLLIAVFCFRSPIAIAISTIPSAIISSVVNAHPNKKLLNYSYLEQMKDILPPIGLSCLMGIAIYPIIYLSLSPLISIIIQIVLGSALYLGLSWLFKLECFLYLFNNAKNFYKKKIAVQVKWKNAN